MAYQGSQPVPEMLTFKSVLQPILATAFHSDSPLEWAFDSQTISRVTFLLKRRRKGADYKRHLVLRDKSCRYHSRIHNSPK